ncbi:MAG: hypothetical protein EON88_18470 [Brevundimonas sp.]|nr:MAG: hypothetical protein EON88_18470 [Brevundimonas sp.]
MRQTGHAFDHHRHARLGRSVRIDTLAALGGTPDALLDEGGEAQPSEPGQFGFGLRRDRRRLVL